MIWEEQGHHIFINIENKYKYTFSSSSAPHEILIWFGCFSSPNNSASKLCNTRGWSPGKRCGKRKLQILQHNNANIQVSSHEPPYLYLYGEGRVRGEDKVVTTEGVSCITTQTTRNSKGVFLTFLKGIRGLHNWTVVYMKGIHGLLVYKVTYKIIRRLHNWQVACHTWVSLRESRV